MRIHRCLVTLPMLLIPLSAAHADEPTAAEALVSEPSRSLFDADLTDPSRELPEPATETQAWHQLYLNKSGIEVRRPVRLGEREVVLGLKGPLMKRKRLGFKLELRF